MLSSNSLVIKDWSQISKNEVFPQILNPEKLRNNNEFGAIYSSD